MYILTFIFGTLIGSFLNVCIYRIPREESIAYPSSHCPKCSTPLKWDNLIPVLSFLLQKGKCRYCGESISPQYPIVELLNGILYAIFFHFYGLLIDFFFYSSIVSILIVISLIDYYHQIIPDSLVIIIFIITIIHKLTLFILYKTPFNLMNSILALLLGGGLFLVIAIVSKGGMGGGDIKLISVLGFMLGIKKLLLNILLSFIIGAVFSVFLLLLNKKGKKDAIPFGPFINIAFIVTLFFGDRIINWYVLRFLV
ncbi:A24 family peptidase [Proteiniborus sp. MB09-C3]|uniref:prepilin peptidase n=1 Tax=Proteiniborus sp. MB09-C3 TaxID=3050072 RepID=UPI002553BBE5|nr:A24 family peptidase [Proteiniborus sp. MB09-C3]WIV11019.1 prepilin peptidase [Proteiniborus sp. MB09-C3]